MKGSMKNPIKTFLIESIHPEAVRLLQEKGEIIDTWERAAEADALISRVLMIGAEQMDRMPALKVIAIHGTGTDTVDLEEAKKRGIRVVNTPHLNANAVAELNVLLLLSVMRKLPAARIMIEARPAEKTDGEMLALAQKNLQGLELRGRTAGLLGFGAIGSRTAEILRYGFGMECIAWSPSLTKERAGAHGSRAAANPEEVLSGADAVIVAMPYSEKTKDFVNEERISLMKRGAVLVNAARGGIVNEQALYGALKEGRLFAAAADVFAEDFPHRDSPLLTLPNFEATPHLGANTDDALYTVGTSCARQIIDVLEGREPEFAVV